MNQQWNPQLIANDERTRALVDWLQVASPAPIAGLVPMTADASFRRYFRLLTDVGSYVVMDAPPLQEDVSRFIHLARFLSERGLNAPHIYAENVQAGFLILSDFGDLTYLNAFKTNAPTPLYENALKVLAILHRCHDTPPFALPHFTHDFMQSEWLLHQQWFLQGLLTLQDHDSALDHVYDLLVENALLQPQVFMYRDFHAGNLMLLPDGKVGLLDFQDALIGPLTYDLASLLRDCYVDWPATDVSKWALFYYDLLQQQGELQDVSAIQFLRWFDWMGIQRHLKALLTFARKTVRDKEARYLAFVPRTLNYIVTVSRKYDELLPMTRFYSDQVLPLFMRKFT